MEKPKTILRKTKANLLAQIEKIEKQCAIHVPRVKHGSTADHSACLHFHDYYGLKKQLQELENE